MCDSLWCDFSKVILFSFLFFLNFIDLPGEISYPVQQQSNSVGGKMSRIQAAKQIKKKKRTFLLNSLDF